MTRVRANVDVIGDVQESLANRVVPRPGPVQPRRHKGRGALLADLAIACGLLSNIPNSRVAFLAARTVEKGGGQEPEGDDAEVRVSGCELLGRLHTCVNRIVLCFESGKWAESRALWTAEGVERTRAIEHKTVFAELSRVHAL